MASWRWWRGKVPPSEETSRTTLEMCIIADSARNSCTSLVCALGDRGLCCYKILDGKTTNQVIWQMQGKSGSMHSALNAKHVVCGSCLSMTAQTAVFMRYPSEVSTKAYC